MTGLFADSGTINLMARYIEDITGSCPLDAHDWEHPKGCDVTCRQNIEVSCWELFFGQGAPGALVIPVVQEEKS